MAFKSTDPVAHAACCPFCQTRLSSIEEAALIKSPREKSSRSAPQPKAPRQFIPRARVVLLRVRLRRLRRGRGVFILVPDWIEISLRIIRKDLLGDGMKEIELMVVLGLWMT